VEKPLTKKVPNCDTSCVEILNLFHTDIIKSLKDQGYYFGHCHDIDIRISKHNAGRVKSTKSRKPFILHYFESFETKSEAYRKELFFKSFSGRQWLYENKIL